MKRTRRQRRRISKKRKRAIAVAELLFRREAAFGTSLMGASIEAAICSNMPGYKPMTDDDHRAFVDSVAPLTPRARRVLGDA